MKVKFNLIQKKVSNNLASLIYQTLSEGNEIILTDDSNRNLCHIFTDIDYSNIIIIYHDGNVETDSFNESSLKFLIEDCDIVSFRKVKSILTVEEI